MRVWDPDLYNRALQFAADAHGAQTIPGTTTPYLLHLSQVCQEALGAVIADPTLDGDLVMTCALLHDTIEDTATTHEALERAFGRAVAEGVDALSKRPALPKDARMTDSLTRIITQPREVWVVKLADRITNLQAPLAHWSKEKIARYHREGEAILSALGSASAHLSDRLRTRLSRYTAHWR